MRCEKVYLIDSENVSDEWVDILDGMGEKDAIFVFYTDKSTHVNCRRVYKLMQYGVGRVWWIKCFEGTNALDFQLVSELGVMIGKENASEYIIVSKDNGYNSVVRYWNERGVAVSRQGCIKMEKRAEETGKTIIAERIIQAGESGDAQDTEKAGESGDAQDTEKARESGEAQGTEKAEINVEEETAEKPEEGESEDFIHKVLKSVDVTDNAMLYAVLAAFQGQAAGGKAYRQLRKMNKEEKAEMGKLLLKDKKKRGMNYVRILLHSNGLNEKHAEGLYGVIMDGPKKNKDKYRKGLMEKYGQKLGETYYRLTKTHYNYVKKV